jgi:hypothetical protein
VEKREKIKKKEETISYLNTYLAQKMRWFVGLLIKNERWRREDIE